MKWVKRIGLGIVGLIALLVLGVLTKFYVFLPKSNPPRADVKAATSPEAIARGEYIANHVSACMGCHSEVDLSKRDETPLPGRLGVGRDFGKEVHHTPAEDDMVKVARKQIAPNITPDKETGIGNWSDGEILRAMREGVSRDGHALFPMMPYAIYHDYLSDDDSLAVIGYLRTIPAVKNDVGHSDIKFPVSMFIRMMPKPIDKSPAPAPPPGRTLERGNWLLHAAMCHQCHDTLDDNWDPVPGHAMAGGTDFHRREGVFYAANVTPDPTTGIGTYTDDDILKVLNEGINKSGRELHAMPFGTYRGMTDDDKHAIILALRAVPPVVATVHAPELVAAAK